MRDTQDTFIFCVSVLHLSPRGLHFEVDLKAGYMTDLCLFEKAQKYVSPQLEPTQRDPGQFWFCTINLLSGE